MIFVAVDNRHVWRQTVFSKYNMSCDERNWTSDDPFNLFGALLFWLTSLFSSLIIQNYYVNLAIIMGQLRGGSRTAATSKMEHFVIKVNG